MQVNKISFSTSHPHFCRKLTKEEEIDYKKNAIEPALNYLGTKEIAMIIHGTSYPETTYDIGVGSPYGKVAAQLIPFEILHGFNSNQLGPIGELNSIKDHSPYQSSIGTKNYLFINFEELTGDKYANILDTKDITDIIPKTKSTDNNYAYSNFHEAFANYSYLIKKATENFDKKIKEENPQALKLLDEYIFFMQEHPNINNYGLFSVLTKNYGTDKFEKWDDIDKNLISKVKNGESYAIDRKHQLQKRSKDELKEYSFGQFLIDKQIKENTLLRNNLNFKYISDMLVGFSPADEWIHQDLFLKNYRLGCPYGGPDGGIQKWDLPVLNPKKLFNEDGTLAKGGIYLKSKLEDALTNFDNVRIDHALGLVDPYIYEKNGNRRGNISEMTDIDPEGNYKKILGNIILPTLQEHGLDKNSPVWEDLVTETPDFMRIYHQEFNLPGITQLEYRKAQDTQDTENWSLIGSHDSDPANLMIKKDWVRKNEAWNPMYLAGVLNANKNSEEYCKKIDQDDKERVKAKFAELFMMCKKIQISFADFFGIEKTYNQGGNDKNPNNWKLRLDEDFENKYYENLSSKNPTAINMPEVLKLAVQGKSDMNKATNTFSYYSDDEVQNIIDNLQHFEKILKE